MKIVTKTSFVVGKCETVPPGSIIDIKDKAEAQSYIDRGLAEKPAAVQDVLASGAEANAGEADSGA